MKSEAEFIIDGEALSVDIGGSPPFVFGAPQTLSGPETDPTYSQPWYPLGFAVLPIFDPSEFAAIRDGISASIERILGSLEIEVGGFELERYHHFVRDDETHFQVAGRTRDLFPPDFNFSIEDVTRRLGKSLGFELTDVDPRTGEQLHVIVRINRPGSTDYNPTHKDIYEDWDAEQVIPQFVNFWIPISGVTSRSALPLAPASHRIPEDRIYRTIEGGVIAGKPYRVRSILHWDGQNLLERAAVTDGDVLVFSPHLIHGCALNAEPDKTRVALELRLFRKS
jgi:Phytanoyl-CoA dioxygenase (PhyH)